MIPLILENDLSFWTSQRPLHLQIRAPGSSRCLACRHPRASPLQEQLRSPHEASIAVPATDGSRAKPHGGTLPWATTSTAAACRLSKQRARFHRAQGLPRAAAADNRNVPDHCGWNGPGCTRAAPLLKVSASRPATMQPSPRPLGHRSLGQSDHCAADSPGRSRAQRKPTRGSSAECDELRAAQRLRKGTSDC